MELKGVNGERMLSRTRSVITLCLLTLLVGCGGARLGPARPDTPAESGAQPAYWPTREWRLSTPKAQGMDERKLADMLEVVRAQSLNLHSLLVIRHGYIVSETYFSPHDQNTRHELYSCTKSFVSTLVGIAVDQGAIDQIDRRVLDYLPRYTCSP
jgi:CubicO group peptidase (beta-lactamase class C family)